MTWEICEISVNNYIKIVNISDGFSSAKRTHKNPGFGPFLPSYQFAFICGSEEIHTRFMHLHHSIHEHWSKQRDTPTRSPFSMLENLLAKGRINTSDGHPLTSRHHFLWRTWKTGWPLVPSRHRCPRHSSWWSCATHVPGQSPWSSVFCYSVRRSPPSRLSKLWGEWNGAKIVSLNATILIAHLFKTKWMLVHGESMQNVAAKVDKPFRPLKVPSHLMKRRGILLTHNPLPSHHMLKVNLTLLWFLWELAVCDVVRPQPAKQQLLWFNEIESRVFNCHL